jgi:head-tail adaptor
MIAPQPAIGDRPHRVLLFNPGTPVPDGDGGYTTADTPLDPPALFMAIEAATAASLERVTAGTALTAATHVVRGPYHPQVSTQTILKFNGRTFYVRGVNNREERGQDMTLLCQEMVA